MAVATVSMTLSDHMAVVRELAQRDTPFERLEAYVESCDGLDEEERAVLWLYAWCGADPRFIAAELGRPVVVLGVS